MRRTEDVSAQSPEETLIAQCRELAAKFAPRAAAHDREGTFPVENFDDLKAGGLLGIMIPKKHGGLGADFLTYTLALEQLAKGDAATGLTFNMHNIVMGALAEVDLGEREGASRRTQVMADFQRWAFREATEGRKVFASATSEPGVGATYSKLKTTYRRVDEGYVLNGTKSFVSMAGYADYYVVAARAEDSSPETPAISYLVVERENPGVRFDSDWDVLGMRSTTSNSMHLTDCFVPKARLFMGMEGMAFYRLLRSPHWQVGGYNGVYLGICSAVFEFVTRFLREKKQPGSDRTHAQDPVVQYRIGEMDIALAAAREVTLSAARQVVANPGTAETNVAIHRAKYMVSELGPRLASDAIRLCGASAISKRLPLERYYRDARCGGLMPARSDDCISYAGKAALGIDIFSASETYW